MFAINKPSHAFQRGFLSGLISWVVEQLSHMLLGFYLLVNGRFIDVFDMIFVYALVFNFLINFFIWLFLNMREKRLDLRGSLRRCLFSNDGN